MSLTRREFAAFIAKFAVLTGIAATIPAAASTPLNYRRPPGAVEEPVFKIVCVRCGRCVSVCPQKIVRQVSPLENLASAGTPVLVENGICALDFECDKVCPTGALQLLPKEKAKMGTATIERDKCIGCGICIKVCMPIVEAINWEDPKKKDKAVVDPAKCLGCGACVPECPVEAISLSPEGAYRPQFRWPSR